MGAVGEVLDRKDRPAYVRFERIPVEDKVASLQAGHYVAQDIDYALITPPYSKDIFKIKVTQWFVDMKQQIATDRIPQEWADIYEKAYQAWKNGQEIPLSGSPIKGWGVISPAQQETLIKMNVLTVDDLSGINDEGIKRVGMGGIDLKNKAVAWLSQLKDKGPLTQENAAIKAKNAQLELSSETLTRQVEELMKQVKSNTTSPVTLVTQSETITAADLLEKTTEPTSDFRQAYQEKFGKKPHHLMKDATIIAALKG